MFLALFNMYIRKFVLIIFAISLLFFHPVSVQEIDYDDLIEKIERLEKTIELQQKTIDHDKKFMI